MPAIFPRWTNQIPLALGVLGPIFIASVVAGAFYFFSPKWTDVGYRPEQPVPFSHKLHAGEMGMDCRYCHNTVETAGHASVPPTQTCMNCHSQVATNSPKLAPIRRSWNKDLPVEWVRVHQPPDYAYFDHAPHVAAGVGCASCHGRIDSMVVVQQAHPLSMSWCLECHRDPEPHLRPLDQVTNMAYDTTTDDYDYKQDPARKRLPEPPVHCSGCHR